MSRIVQVCLVVLLGLLGALGRPAYAQQKPELALVGVHSTEADAATLARLSSALYAGFKATNDFQIIESNTALSRLATRRGQLQSTIFGGEAEILLAEARLLIEQAEFAQASLTLGQARDAILFYQEHLTTQAELIDIHLSLALMYLGLGQEDKAMAELRRVVTWNPKQQLDPNRFPPNIIDAYQGMRAEALSQAGSLQLASDPPSARVYLDGALQGETPLTLSSVPPGVHFLRFEDASNRADYREVTVVPGQSSSVSAVLKTPNFHMGSTRQFDQLPRERRAAQVVGIYSALAHALEVDFVAVAELNGEFLTLQLFRPASGQFTVAYQAQVTGPGNEMNSVVKGLVKRVTGTLAPDSSIQPRYLGAPIDVDPATNTTLAQLVFGPVEASASRDAPRDAPPRRTDEPTEDPQGSAAAPSGEGGPGPQTWEEEPRESAKPLLRKTWVWVLASLLVAAGGGATYWQLQGAEGGTNLTYTLP